MPGSSRLPVSIRENIPKLSKNRHVLELNLDLYVSRLRRMLGFCRKKICGANDCVTGSATSSSLSSCCAGREKRTTSSRAEASSAPSNNSTLQRANTCIEPSSHYQVCAIKCNSRSRKRRSRSRNRSCRRVRVSSGTRRYLKMDGPSTKCARSCRNWQR